LDRLQVYAAHYRERVAAISHAEQLLSTSARLFTWLATARAEPSHFGALTYTHSQRSALKHKSHSESLLEVVRSDLEKVKKLEAEFSSKWEVIHTQQVTEREEKRLAEEEAREKKELERRKELERLELLDEEKIREFNERHPEGEIQKAEKKTRKSRARREIIGLEEEQDDQEEEEPLAVSSSESSDEEKDEEKEKPKRKRQVIGGDEDDEESAKEENEDENNDDDLFGGADVDEENNETQPPRKRHRQVIGDDDEDDEDGKPDESEPDEVLFYEESW